MPISSKEKLPESNYIFLISKEPQETFLSDFKRTFQSLIILVDFKLFDTDCNKEKY